MRNPQRSFGKMLRMGWKKSKISRLGKPGKAKANRVNFLLNDK